MSRATATATLGLAIALIGSTTAPQPVGFARIATLVAAHPLAPMLAQYDREIAALRRTSALPGLGDPAQQAKRSAAIVEHRTAGATAQVKRLAASPQRDAASERAAFADIDAAQRAGDPALAGYRDDLARETNATLREYAGAIAQRNARALAAREQQLREKELTLAFDLARRDAGQRLALRLQLQDLHLAAVKRRALERRLASFDRAEESAVSAQRRSDAGILAVYRQSLARAGDAATATLAIQTRSKAEANLDVRMGVSRAGASATIVPNLGARLRAFTASYPGGRAADGVTAALRTTAHELPQRFGALARADRESVAHTAAQIRTLENDRAQVYRSILAHIGRVAQQLAQQRGLRAVVVAPAPPRGSVDVTAALAAMLRSF